jgi:hypothetical protein
MPGKQLPKELADKILESINEDPEMEPGQADTTPATEAPKPKEEAHKGREGNEGRIKD